ncbi:MAG: hypothetical protein AB7U29_00470 [Desulfobulbus sp.]
MELLACPKCGSEWFVSTRTGDRIAFQMDDAYQPVIADPEGFSAQAAPIAQEHIYCGACSWQGPVTDLVESR